MALQFGGGGRGGTILDLKNSGTDGRTGGRPWENQGPYWTLRAVGGKELAANESDRDPLL